MSQKIGILGYMIQNKMTKIDLPVIPDEIIIDRIYLVRNQKVMIDRDLAILFGIETKVLKQSVKRNIERFPTDFMFEMTKEELVNWRSQIVTSNSEKMGLRYAPYCFTEQGVTMLSCVLNSKEIKMIFSALKQLLNPPQVSRKKIGFKIGSA